jgi:hypothetical protein
VHPPLLQSYITMTALLLPLDSDVVPHLSLLVLLGDLLNDWCEVSRILNCQLMSCKKTVCGSLPARLWSIASLVVLGAKHSAGMLFAYGMHGRKTLVGSIDQLPECQCSVKMANFPVCRPHSTSSNPSCAPAIRLHDRVMARD